MHKTGARHTTRPCLYLSIQGLEQTVGTQYDEYAIAEEQAHDTYDETYLDHVLLLDETSSISQCVGRSTDGEHHTY